jgi:hypothetical protein
MNEGNFYYQHKTEIIFVPYSWFEVWRDLDGPETTELVEGYESLGWRAERWNIGYSKNFVSEDPERGGKFYKVNFERKLLKNLKVFVFTNHYFQYPIEIIVLYGTVTEIATGLINRHNPAIYDQSVAVLIGF